MMSSYDWLELEILTNDIDLLRHHLTEARSRNATARVRTLEEEISRSEDRRNKLLSHLTINMISDAEVRTHTRSRRPGGPEPKPIDGKHRSVIEADNAAERLQAAVCDETGENPTAVLTSKDDRQDRGERAASAEENSAQLATLASLTKDIDVCWIRLAVAKLRKDQELVRRLENEIATWATRRERLLATVAHGGAVDSDHHRDPIEQRVLDDEARQMTDLVPSPEHALSAGHPTSSGEVSEQRKAEKVGSQRDPKPDDDCAPAFVQELPPDNVECVPASSLTDDQVVAGDVDATPAAVPALLWNGVEHGPHSSTAADQIVADDADGPSPDGGTIEKPDQTKVGDQRHLSGLEDHTAAREARSSKREGEGTMWDNSELELAKKKIEARCDEMFERHRQELEAMLSRQAEELRQLQNDREELEALQQAIGAALRKFKAPADPGVTSLEDERASRLQGLA